MRLTQVTQLYAKDNFAIEGTMVGGTDAWLAIERHGFIPGSGFVSMETKIMIGGATQAELDAIVAAMRAPIDRQRAEKAKPFITSPADADVTMEAADVS